MAFPSNPAVNDTHTDATGTVWSWSGTTWYRTAVSSNNETLYGPKLPPGGEPGQVLSIDSNNRRYWQTQTFNFATIADVDSRVLAQMGSSFSNRTVLLNTSTAIFADGEVGVPDPNGGPGWYYKNTQGNKINWYFYGGVGATNYQLGSFDGWYAVIEIRAQGSYPYLTVYTQPTGSGDASWYKSRINYVDEATTQALAPGLYLFHTAGLDVTGIYSGLTRVPLPVGAGSVGTQAATEDLWLMALSTSSNLAAGTNEFVVREQAVVLGGVTTNYQHVALPTYQAPYTEYYKGTYTAAVDYPETGALGQWIINSTDDTTLVWDAESGDWVATGSGAVAPTSTVQDYPFQYVYSSTDGSGYGFSNAYPAANWSNTPDGKLQSTGFSSDILSRHIKFATLKNPGDQVTVQVSNNTAAYYRFGIFGLVPGTDASAIAWKVAGQPGTGVNWMTDVQADRDKIEMQVSYMEPYWGGTSYGYNMTGRSNSTGLGGLTGNQGELPVTFRVADDYAIEMYIDGNYHVRTQIIPSSGVDLYFHMYGETGRILEQPTGNGVNYIGGTSPNATGAKYYMSDAAPSRVEATILETGNGYWLYSDTEASGTGYNVQLTDNEASQARYCRVFQDYTGLTLQERADLTLPIATADETGLDRVEFLARGYFHSLDMTLEEISAKMALYAPALAAATSGSVEACLAQLQILTQPVSAGGEALDIEPFYSGYVAGGTSDTRMNFPTSSQTRADYGITGARFWGQGTSLGQMEFYFDSNNQPNAALDWASQARTVTFTIPGSDPAFEGTFTLDPSEVVYQSGSQVTYSNPSGGGWNHVQVEALAQWANANGLQSGLGTITFEAPTPTSPALALGEQDLVNELITTLQTHLQKFPR